MFGPNEKTARIKHPRLPWFIGGMAFCVYVATLGHHVALKSLVLTALVAGWSGDLQTDRPLLWLATAPVRLLPDDWVSLALNLESAGFAALTLVLLARCVQLLPLNRLRIQSMFQRHSSGLFERRDAWLPVVVACLVAGLELGFWQEAVSATGQMPDLLLFAAAVWCLLEYRVSGQRGWLDRLALLWGMGMAENWAMIAALPLLAVTLIWLWGMEFLKAERWLRVLWRLLLGGSVLLLLPLVNWLSPHSHWTLPHALKETARALAGSLSGPWHEFTGFNVNVTIVMTLFYLLPVVPLIFRLKNEGSYNTSLQARIQIVTLQLLYTAFLVTEIWLTLHPVSGPQNIMAQNSRLGTALLSLVFLNALGAGYLTAHFLLICGADLNALRKHNAQFRLPPFLPDWLRKAVLPLLYVLPVILLVTLAARNLGLIRDGNRSPLLRFATTVVASLPPGGGIVLSDDPQRLIFVRDVLSRRPDYRQWAVVDTAALPDPDYRAALQRKCPLGWTDLGPRQPLSQADMTYLIYWLAGTNRIYYIHPSFGFFFENLDAEARGLAGKINRAAPGATQLPPLTPELRQENEQFWDRAWTNGLSALPVKTPAGRKAPPKHMYSLAEPDAADTRLAADWYSMALDSWAVTLQQAGQWPAARQRFEQALALNPNNLSAQINLAFNRNHTATNQPPLAGAGGLWYQLNGRHGGIQNLLKADGPLDTPVMDYAGGLFCQDVGLPRQAIELLNRARLLAPDDLAPQLALAELYVHDQLPDQALATIRQIRRQTAAHPLNEETRVRLSLLEAGAWLNTSNHLAGDRVLQSALLNHPKDTGALNTAVDLYVQAGDLTNALTLVQSRLAQTPDDLALLRRQAGLLEMTGQFSRALKTIDHALSLTNALPLLVDRAGDRLLTGDLPGAEADYQLLGQSAVEKWIPPYGLAQIALRRHDTNAAVRLLHASYSATTGGTPPQAFVLRQLQQLMSGARQ